MAFLKNPQNYKDFLKRHRRHYRNETAYSITLKRLKPSNVSKILALKTTINQVNQIANIIITLERCFSMDEDRAVSNALDIWLLKMDNIEQYMKRWFLIGTPEQRTKLLTIKRAIKEFKARGFVEADSVALNPSLPYIRANVGNLVYPKYWKPKPGINICGIYQRQMEIGIKGYTQAYIPKSFFSLESK